MRAKFVRGSGRLIYGLKSCSSVSTAAYSRRMLAVAENARKTGSRKTRGGFMRRCLSRHRFALALAALILLAAVPSGPVNPRPASAANLPALRMFAQQTSLPGRPAPDSQTAQLQTSLPGSPPAPPQPSEQTRTEQYTLSHERYEKAVAYSRAGYTLYFVSYFLGALFLFLILRLGVAAKFRDIAENVSEKRWVQSFVFAPLS